MGTYKNKAYPLRINNKLMDKVRKIADIEDRKVSQQLERIIKEYVKNYEQKNGEIEVKQINIENIEHSGKGDINIK